MDAYTINHFIYTKEKKFKKILTKLDFRFANFMNNTTITNIFNSDNSNIDYINT